MTIVSYCVYVILWQNLIIHFTSMSLQVHDSRLFANYNMWQISYTLVCIYKNTCRGRQHNIDMRTIIPCHTAYRMARLDTFVMYSFTRMRWIRCTTSTIIYTRLDQVTGFPRTPGLCTYYDNS